MITRKRTVCLMMICLLVLVTSYADAKEKRLNSQAVDDIYAAIRHAGPKYETMSRNVTFTNEGMNLIGTLTVPISNMKMQVVLYLNGFAGDRNELIFNGGQEYIWQRLSRFLAEQGIASLRIDFRGSGESDGDFTMASFSTQISDALAALEFIRHSLRSEVDWKSIGILGFSQGGLVGSYATARDGNVDSLLLWSPVSHPPMVYEGLFTKAGMKQGLALAEGGTITLGIYFNDVYIDWDVSMGKRFFEEIFQYAPVAELCKTYTGPLMALCGSQDPVIWPQPHQSDTYMRHHDGFEKLVMLEADHAFNWWDGAEPEKFHDAIYWSAAWFIHTLR